jgi:hypothetical protein
VSGMSVDYNRAVLDSLSAPDPRMFYSLFTPALRQQAVLGASSVTPWPP